MSDTASTPEDLYDLIRLVRPAYKALEAAVTQELSSANLSVPRRALLEMLHDAGPLTVPEMGRRLVAPRQFIQKIVNELLETGLVVRRLNPAHRRSVLLALTPEGDAAIRAVLARERAVMKPIAAELSAEELAIARKVLGTIITAFQAHVAAPTEETER